MNKLVRENIMKGMAVLLISTMYLTIVSYASWHVGTAIELGLDDYYIWIPVIGLGILSIFCFVVMMEFILDIIDNNRQLHHGKKGA